MMNWFIIPPKQNRSAPRSSYGFTLAEVTMAIGVISFGLLSIMGLVPVGLSTLRSAMDQTVEAQIIQKLSGKILLTPFSKLDGEFSEKAFFYDQEGVETSDSSSAIFSVETALTQAAYPGAPVTGTNSLRQVQIDVTRMPGSRSVHRFNVYVPNSGN